MHTMPRSGAMAWILRTFVRGALFASLAHAAAAGPDGYYRQPAIHGETVVFVAESDLWKVPAAGGVATRLTSHAGDESLPAISPDGQLVAFIAEYEGPAELYTMPLTGGLPTRRTYGAGARLSSVGWTPDGKVLLGTDGYSTLPNRQLVQLDLSDPAAAATPALVPLAQAADGCYDDAGVLYFTRLPFQGSHTKRYRGGTAQNLWRFDGRSEATPLTGDYAGTSKAPLFWKGRVYFASDRDGTMNLWSMRPDGGDARQHTRHNGWDIAGPSLGGGKIVYQLGADLRVYDIAAEQDTALAIRLDSDFDQTRETWIKKPLDYLSAAHISADGERVVLTARGEVFVAPHRQGRVVQLRSAATEALPRFRDARFLPDGKSVLALSDESGEVEFWTYPANGVGPARQLTRDGDVLRWEGVPSPDGRLIAHHDKNLRLFVYDFESGENRKIDESKIDQFEGLAWSPDSRWLAYVTQAENSFRVIRLHCVADGTRTDATTDRFDSFSPAWSSDGKWLYFLSDRNLVSIVGSPWGSYQPEPFLDKTTRIYEVALTVGARSPFAPRDELQPAEKKDEKKSDAPASAAAQSKPAEATPAESKPAESRPAGTEVTIEVAGLAQRMAEIPVKPGNFSGLFATEKALFWISRPTGEDERSLQAVKITNENPEVKTVLAGVRRVELSGNGKKLLLQKGESLYIVDAEPAAAELDKKNVVLDGWMMAFRPREQWRQMFREAWRLERDYFYDRGMHGVNWQAMRDKYEPLVARVTTRGELSDLLAQMVSELSALHIFVHGGDTRDGPDQIANGSLGALLARDAGAGGYRVTHIYAHDTDEPQRASPLARPGVNVQVGDVIEQIDGVATLSVPDAAALLRNKAGKQVLLHVKPAARIDADRAPASTNTAAEPEADPRQVIVTPLGSGDGSELRYHEWELTRRRLVDEWGAGEMGYVHLRAMGGGNYTEWAKGYFPVFNRQGLIVDVRHNRGGNIDSWILSRLMRKAWFFWSQRVGQSPIWNMQYAFRGHVVVLCNEFTASDGEAFSEGIKRLGLGRVIGTRTWGGEIWLSSDNFLRDGGIATAAEYGVFGPEGVWLIEGHGVDPDQIVDNLPHASFRGEDAQLRAAVEYLKQKIAAEPVPPPVAPQHPDKSK